jgi:hypothetical protein
MGGGGGGVNDPERSHWLEPHFRRPSAFPPDLACFSPIKLKACVILMSIRKAWAGHEEEEERGEERRCRVKVTNPPRQPPPPSTRHQRGLRVVHHHRHVGAKTPCGGGLGPIDTPIGVDGSTG